MNNTPNPTPLRIIIADDEGIIRLGLKTMIQALGHKVIATVRTGVEAVEKVKQLQPDLLLLDIKMPVMDGLTAARILSREAPLPIVLLTAYSQRPLIEQAVDALVMGYLVKPVDEGKLAPSIDMAITRFKELNQTAQTVEALKTKLADQEMIDQARQLLISRGLSEHEAYHALQTAARKRQITIAEQAERVLKRGDLE